MTSVRASVLGFALLALACGTRDVSPIDPTIGTIPPDTVSLRVGQTVRAGVADITFTAVPEDGRCPSDVVCIWAGNAVAELTVGPAVGEGPTFRLLLNTTLDPREGEAWGLRLTLVDLAPLPVSTRATQPQDYLLRLGVSVR